ncbi:MAG: bifunctional aspartate kinase/homoserine dehydrogenase I [Gammaproteobacteria bacterium]|nr:bifunctional aspartate kinase/homoserine dehydrogenase I [Gammaproteobacteria bacterium]NNF48526.1 bifunctional aspartate kinase/homoserine dehydrogenase I [Woeseiaceae bacterium]MBT8093640.1 bifunctional aspartate kinase/homoserine dehydrogenase I [Gammaproteobacteria bacterium]MBT8106298.1 bifunctional aspartate kinase/homoserine dehydrogenase I [Gammaproteobacteria bacterium]NNK26312.1 bifunctional aspartate kinase/homoserine dehydrogenase I [Woeseiaceae bacterium]
MRSKSVSDKRWKIHKFGGSSLADADCFRRVAGIVRDLPGERLGVVVSAMGGMTDALIDLAVLAERVDDSYRVALGGIGERYTTTARTLLSGNALDEVLEAWGRDAADINDILEAVALVKSAPQRSRDVIAGYGEIWSARLLAAFLGQEAPGRGGTWLDAREIITVHQTELGPTMLWDESQSKFDAVVPGDFQGIAVVTGFIASDEQGLQTTLGRNGSDYSAAIMAALSDADELTIWTDVDGVMSADPRRVPEAQVIDRMTYNEAMELAYFGAKVIHPQTLGPVIERDIPVWIRNSHNPAYPGSRIAASANDIDNIKGITAIGGMALVNLEGSGMIGVPGTADRLFAGLKDAGVSVTLISQASSEHSICIAVPRDLASRARTVIRDAFAEELDSGQIQNVEVTDDQSIVAVVGDGMAGTPGVAARFFGTLGRAGINIRAIAQGSSERNISVVVDSHDATKALRAAHSGFYLSHKTISIGLIGPGTVGAALLRQLEKQGQRLADQFNLDLRVRAIARSQTMLLGERRVDLATWQDDFDESAIETDLEAFEAHVNPDHLPHAVIIDCTASQFVASKYAGWLSRGVHVITPNKKAFSGDYAYYKSLQAAADEGSSHYFYETTVGAALPVVSTLCDLIYTGDVVRSIRGIFSGTLAYLFNVYDGTTPFSEIVRTAKDNGFTEPDPRDDLSGMDVARKLTILGRELGLALQIGAFPVRSLVPEALQDCSIEEFLERLPDYDDDVDALYRQAVDANRQLRYVATLDADGSASVGLEAVDEDHPFCNINLTDNIVQFETERYSQNPLVVQGPGAGPEVTAGGAFADLLRLANYLSKGLGYV